MNIEAVSFGWQLGCSLRRFGFPTDRQVTAIDLFFQQADAMGEVHVEVA